MAGQSPKSLSDIEIFDILTSMKSDVLNTEADEFIRKWGIKPAVKNRINRHWSHSTKSFEDKFVEAVTLALSLK